MIITSDAGGPLRIPVRSSRRLLLWLLATHLGACACALVLPVPIAWRTVLILAIGASLGWQLWAGVFASAPWSIRHLTCATHGWELTRADGVRRRARLLGSTWVSRDLVVLRFRVGHWPRSLVIAADAVDAELLRRLRARLRLIGVDDGTSAPDGDLR